MLQTASRTLTFFLILPVLTCNLLPLIYLTLNPETIMKSYPLTQCAAVNRYLLFINEAPQKNRLLYCRATIHGYSLTKVSTPPTIRLCFNATPHAKKTLSLVLFFNRNELTNKGL